MIESIHAFQANKRDNLRLLLIGSLDDAIQNEVHSLIKADKNISYVGWKDSAELMDYLCAADVYLQPGSQSAIMQNALCLRCAVILADVDSHKPFICGNGWLLNKNLSLHHVFDCISCNPSQLEYMAEKSLAIARQLLDYSKLAARLYV